MIGLKGFSSGGGVGSTISCNIVKRMITAGMIILSLLASLCVIAISAELLCPRFCLRTVSVECPLQDDAVKIDTASRMLLLCARGEIQRSFSVAFGRGGFGKSREGDLKTPLGVYNLDRAGFQNQAR